MPRRRSRNEIAPSRRSRTTARDASARDASGMDRSGDTNVSTSAAHPGGGSTSMSALIVVARARSLDGAADRGSNIERVDRVGDST
eukprot:30612-Pelagococcus_subviridis.AAC.26